MKTKTVLGHAVSFERRRYGSQTYTWAYVKMGQEFVSLGDPWPCINVPREELEREVRRVCGCPASA